MQQGNTKKKNTGLIIGIICGAVVVIAAIIILIVVLTSKGVKGKYVLSGMEDKSGKDYSALLSLLGGSKMYIDFKGDGKCEMNTGSGSFSYDSDSGSESSQESKVVECKYTNDTIEPVDGKEEDKVKYTVDGDKVTVTTENGEKMIFTKE